MSHLHQEKGENQTENVVKNQNDEEENDAAPSGFTEALRDKYCFDCSDYTFGSCQVVFHGKAGSGGAKAELAHLRNVVLCNANLTYAGIPREGLASLCPNVIDLDISGNNLTSWKEILPIFEQLKHLKFVNLGGNPIHGDQEYLEALDKPLSNVENLVLNGTFIRWKEVLKFVKRLPALKEIHVCYNDYEEFSEIGDDDLQNIECFRANNNNIQKWSEVWKLRHLPKLQSLILSGNPVKDIFYDHGCCTGDHENCQEPIEDCDPKNCCDEIVIAESTDQNSSHLSASSCDTAESSKNQFSNEPPSDILEKQPSEISNELSLETPKELSSENDTQNMISYAETDGSDDCRNCSRDQSFKEADGEQGSTDVPTLDQDNASSSHQNELEEEFQAMVTECLTVANKMADSKSVPIKGTNRCRYDSLQSEDGDYDDCPKQMGEMTKLWAQISNDIAEQTLHEVVEQMSQETMKQMSKVESGKMSTETTGNTPKDGQMPPEAIGQMPSETMRQSPKDGQIPAEVLGQMIPEVSGQIPKDGQIPAEEKREIPKDGQMPTEALGQTPSETLEQTPSKEPTEAAAAADEAKCRPFQNLHTLCLTETDIHHTDHLEALTKFPSLKSVRLRDVPLYKEHSDEVSWKLYLASLPNIELLNGSEISSTDRENSERFYLRHYLDFEEKPKRHEELEQKHGKLSKIIDIDIGANFQKFAMIQFYINGKKSFTKKLHMRDSVDKLRSLLAKELKTSKRNFRLFFLPCGPNHVYENGEFPEEEKMASYLPMSRYNMQNGDEIHIELSTNIQNMESRVTITNSKWQSRVPRD